ncbi:hypothetical protein KTR9_3093 [Gordonia sp. KTR9]|nr:hypothetical protein KTR9_3093 [Gordonia sp. KTR9]
MRYQVRGDAKYRPESQVRAKVSSTDCPWDQPARINSLIVATSAELSRLG